MELAPRETVILAKRTLDSCTGVSQIQRVMSFGSWTATALEASRARLMT